jgi:hypothetical protein
MRLLTIFQYNDYRGIKSPQTVLAFIFDFQRYRCRAI